MRKLAKLGSMGALAVGASLAGCGGGEEGTGGAGAPIPLELRATSSALGSTPDGAPDGLPIADASGTTFTVVDARIHVRDVELDLPLGTGCADVEGALAGGARCEPPHEPEGEAKLVIDGPFVVDLLAGTATPDLSAVRVPDLPYRRVDLRVDDLRDAGDDLDGASFALRATFDRAGVPSELVLRLSVNEDVRIEQPGGVQVIPGAPLLVELDAATWLSGVDLAACVDSGAADAGAGLVAIDDRTAGDACGGIEDQVEEQLKRSARLGRDDRHHLEPGDDHGGGLEPGDDHGGGLEPGDDQGGNR